LVELPEPSSIDRAARPDRGRDVGGVAGEQVGFAARRIIFGERGDILEQRRPGRVVEPARGDRLLLLLTESGTDVGAKGDVDARVVRRNLPEIAHNAHVKDPL
jgi:hypothetical protein